MHIYMLMYKYMLNHIQRSYEAICMTNETMTNETQFEERPQKHHCRVGYGVCLVTISRLSCTLLHMKLYDDA